MNDNLPAKKDPPARVEFGGIGTLEGDVVVGDQDNSVDNSTHIAGNVDTLEQGNKTEIGGDMSGDVAQIKGGEVTQTYYDQMLEVLTNAEAEQEYKNIAEARSQDEGSEILAEAIKSDMLSAASGFSSKAKQAAEVPESVDKSDLVRLLETMGQISKVLAARAIKLIDLTSATSLVKVAINIVLPSFGSLKKP